jgi:hypothetical protein
MDSTHMVKKKVIGMVVCSVLLVGNCVTSVTEAAFAPADSQERQSCDSLWTQFEAIRAQWTNGLESVSVEDLKSGLSLIDQILIKLPLRPQGGAPQDWENIKNERQTLGQERKIINQALMQRASQPINIGPQRRGESRDEEVLTSWGQLKGALDRFSRKVINGDELKRRIEATKDYYLFDSSVERPRLVPEEEWRRAKVVEMFHRVMQYLPNTRIAQWCLQELHEQTGNDDLLKTCEYMRLLLLSQSARWDDAEGYALKADKDLLLVREAIAKLCNIMKDPEVDASVYDRVRNLLEAIEGECRNFFPSDWNN